jgi:hypothetical protein
MGRVPWPGRRCAGAHAVHGDIGLAQARAPDQLVQDPSERRLVFRRLHPQCCHRGLEPAQVIVEPEEGAAPDADHVIGHVGAPIAPVGDRYARLAQRHEAAVDIGGPSGPAFPLTHLARSLTTRRQR